MSRLAGGDMVENAHDCMHSLRTRMLEMSPQLVVQGDEVGHATGTREQGYADCMSGRVVRIRSIKVEFCSSLGIAQPLLGLYYVVVTKIRPLSR
jgi:hypothetical protein